MEPKSEWHRLACVVWICFIGTALAMAIGEFIAVPALLWLQYDTPYHLPTWNQVGKMVALVVVLSLLLSALTWFGYRKELAREIKWREKQLLEHTRNQEFEQAARIREQLARLKTRMFGAARDDHAG